MRAHDFPFFSGEFQNQAIFYKNMSDIEKCLPFPEHPYEFKHRKANEDKKAVDHFRLDYWVLLQDKKPENELVLLFEYKHAGINLKWNTSNNANYSDPFSHIKNFSVPWEDNAKKLGKLKYKLCTNKEFKGMFSNWNKDYDRDIVIINFATVPVWVETTIEKRLDICIKQEEFIEWRSKVTNMLKPESKRPNWEAVWWLHREGQQLDSWDDRQKKPHYYKCFGVYFFAHLDLVSSE